MRDEEIPNKGSHRARPCVNAINNAVQHNFCTILSIGVGCLQDVPIAFATWDGRTLILLNPE